MLEKALKNRSLLYQGCLGKIEPSRGGFAEFFSEYSQVLLEEKFDGQWGALEILPNTKKAKVTSRNGLEKNPEGVLEYAAAFFNDKGVSGQTILAGELGFGSQAETELAKKRGHHRYLAYDVILANGRFVGDKPLLERKTILKGLLHGANPDLLVESPYRVETSVDAAWDYYRQIVDKGGEGLIAKLLETRYSVVGGKIREWFKIKKTVSKEFRIVGYEYSEALKYKAKGWIKNIHLAEIEDKTDTVIVHLGSMDEATREAVSKDPKGHIGKIVEVGGNEIFKSGSIRHPFFIRFREDI